MKQWYKITAKKDRAEILIYEQIGQGFWNESGVSAKKFISDLNALDVSAIDLFVNCPGGNVFEGNSIYNALVRHKAKISATIDGVAASIASVIVMAADKISMPENALMMIHDPSALVMGTAEDMQKMIEALSRVKTGLISAYMTHTTASEKEVDKMMQAETWMTAKEAVDIGFATEMIEPVKIAANFEAFKHFRNVPDSISGKIILQEEKTMDITLDLIRNEHPEIVTEILAGVNLDYVRANLPDVVSKIETEGIEAGAKTERLRIQSVSEQTMPGHEKLIADLMFDGKTTGEMAAVKVLQAEKQIRSQMAADLVKDAPDAIEQPPVDGTDGTVSDNLPVDKRCEAKWKKSQKLQDEFLGDFDAYLAYETAVDAGKVKVLGA